MKPKKLDGSFVLVIEGGARRNHGIDVVEWKEKLQVENGSSSDVQDELGR